MLEVHPLRFRTLTLTRSSAGMRSKTVLSSATLSIFLPIFYPSTSSTRTCSPISVSSTCMASPRREVETAITTNTLASYAGSPSSSARFNVESKIRLLEHRKSLPYQSKIECPPKHICPYSKWTICCYSNSAPICSWSSMRLNWTLWHRPFRKPWKNTWKARIDFCRSTQG